MLKLARCPQPATYPELMRALGELRHTGEKGHRALLQAVLPRLAQMEALPAALVPQLLQVKGAGDDRRAHACLPRPENDGGLPWHTPSA